MSHIQVIYKFSYTGAWFVDQQREITNSLSSQVTYNYIVQIIWYIVNANELHENE